MSRAVRCESDKAEFAHLASGGANNREIGSRKRDLRTAAAAHSSAFLTSSESRARLQARSGASLLQLYNLYEIHLDYSIYL